VICLKPIGVVEEGVSRPGEGSPRSKYEVVSIIRIFDEYVEGLDGVDEYSHLIIVFYMHEENEIRLRIRPWGVERYPVVGIFATRSPPRPNPVGVSVVELIEVNKPRLRVRGLDAWSGTPVLDIKPYDYYDVVKSPRVPWWFREKWGEWRSKWQYDETAPWLGPCTEAE
jgi:tRNA-Thr(GGU) m(6)t(6)A37 methyltransferase TsaA